MHLEEKMAEINNRLVKSYEVVQELDEDTLTSLLKKEKKSIGVPLINLKTIGTLSIEI